MQWCRHGIIKQASIGQRSKNISKNRIRIIRFHPFGEYFFYLSCNRSFYVGDAITEEDIKANFENGTLKMTIPKKEAKAVPEKKFISIEG